MLIQTYEFTWAFCKINSSVAIMVCEDEIYFLLG